MSEIIIYSEPNFFYEAASVISWQESRIASWVHKRKNLGVSENDINAYLKSFTDYIQIVKKDAQTVFEKYAHLLDICNVCKDGSSLISVMSTTPVTTPWAELDAQEARSLVVGAIYSLLGPSFDASDEDEAEHTDEEVLHYILENAQSEDEKMLIIRFFYERQRVLPELFDFISEVAESCKRCYGNVQEAHDALLALVRGVDDNFNSILQALGVNTLLVNDIAARYHIRISAVHFNSISLTQRFDECYVYVGTGVQKTIGYEFPNQTYDISALKVLAETTRWQILTCLSKQKLRVKDLSEKLNLTPATVSHHMDALLQADLISIYFGESGERRLGYSVNAKKLQELSNDIARLAREVNNG